MTCASSHSDLRTLAQRSLEGAAESFAQVVVSPLGDELAQLAHPGLRLSCAEPETCADLPNHPPTAAAAVKPGARP